MRIYPTSALTVEAQQGVVDLRQRLAEHEYIVGRYNYRRKLYAAAEDRFATMLEDYPDYGEPDKVLFMLGRAQMKQKHIADAEQTFEQLKNEHPDSSYSRKIPKLPEVPPEVEEAAEVVDEEAPTNGSEESSGAEEDS